MTNQELLGGISTSELPSISQEAIDKVSEAWAKDPNYLIDKFGQLMAVQQHLAENIALHTRGGARDQREMQLARDIAILTWLCIVAQQEIDQRR